MTGPSVEDRGICVLVLSDPGQCTARATAVQGLFEQELERVFGSATVEVRPQFLGVSDTRTLDFRPINALREEFTRVDAVLLLTEMPRLSHGRPEIAKLIPDQHAASLSYPTLGVLAGRRRLIALFMSCVLRLVDNAPEEERERYDLRWNRWLEPEAAEDAARYLHAHTLTGVPRTVLGMVATNAPWRTAPQLSSALAAASAAGAFGVFYSSIWQMSAALSTGRLVMIGLLAITSMVVWLLLSNGLWERASHAEPAEVLVYYNLSTVLTLFLCVLALYLTLFVLILAAGLVVIDPDFMEQIVQRPTELSSYTGIAWLSAAMGVVAGGLGTSFDESTDLRHLTHGQREIARRPQDADHR